MTSLLLAVATGFLMLAACGGVTRGGAGEDGGASSSGGGASSSSSGSSSGGSGSSSGGSGSSSGGGVAGCPAAQPTCSFPCTSPCSPVGLECEYGDSPSYQCTAHWSCQSSGWVFDDSASTCVTGSCPPNAASVPNGQSCTPDGLDCAYPQGECNCSTLGGPASDAGGPVWQCFSPGNCPEPRPRVGSPCSQPNQQCDYGACSGGVALQCTNGYWQRTTVPCPV